MLGFLSRKEKINFIELKYLVGHEAAVRADFGPEKKVYRGRLGWNYADQIPVIVFKGDDIRFINYRSYRDRAFSFGENDEVALGSQGKYRQVVR